MIDINMLPSSKWGFPFVFLFFPESTYRHQATIDDEVVTMEILDTAGQVGASATLHRKQ